MKLAIITAILAAGNVWWALDGPLPGLNWFFAGVCTTIAAHEFLYLLALYFDPVDASSLAKASKRSD